MPTLHIKVAAADAKRIAAMAKASEVPLERWLRSAVLHACAVDEGHVRELEERDVLRSQVDRGRFARLSHQLRGLSSGTVDQLVEALVLAQQQGRREGAASALERLTVCRARKGGA